MLEQCQAACPGHPPLRRRFARVPARTEFECLLAEARGLYDASGGTVPDPSNLRNPAPAYQSGLLCESIKNWNVYRCPLDTPYLPAWNLRAQKLSSYLVNGAVSGYGRISPDSYKTFEFRPDAIVLWQALETNPGDWNDGSSNPTEGITRLHSLGTSVGVIDGHVEHLKTVNFYAEVNIPGKNRLFCNPGTEDGR